MAPWAWALAFIAILLVFGWLMDRQTKRRRRGLLAGGPRPAGYAGSDRIAVAERVDPGTGTRTRWMGEGGGGLGGAP